MNRLLATIATATLLSAGGAYAQSTFTGPDSLGQIEEEVSQEFARLGVDRDTGTLTMSELSQVYLILEDTDLSDEQKLQRLETMAPTD